jgi:uncharacterized protein DUF1302
MRALAATLSVGLLAVGIGRTASGQGPEERFQFGGWSRTSLEIGLSDAGYDADAPDPLEAPHDRLVARQQLHLRERYARGKSFEVVLSGLLSYGLFESGAFPRAGTRFEAEVREAYVGLYSKRVDFRLGNQRVAWGHADAFSPNDVVNLRDLRDPVLEETELRHEPTFLLRADAPLGFGSLQVIAAPFFRRDRYDAYGPNWSFLQIDAPAGYRGLLTSLTQTGSLTTDEAGRALLSDRGAPRDDLSGIEVGARFDWKVGRFDVSHYYHQGFHGTPDFQVAPALRSLLDATEWSTATPDDVRALFARLGSGSDVTTRWRRRHHVGLGATATTSRLVLRLDAAYEHPGLFYDRNLNGWRSPVVKAVLGLELPSPDPGRTLLVEVLHQRIRDPPPAGGLLHTDRRTSAVAVLYRWTWRDRLELEPRVVVGFAPGSYLLRPQVAWKRDGFTVRLGTVLLGGDDLSYGRWFRRNRSAYVTLKRSF